MKSKIVTGEFTNDCTCLLYEHEGETKSLDTDFGSSCYCNCWEIALEDFAIITQELRNSNETNWWRVANLRLWDRETGGYFSAKTVADLIEGMTVRGDWTMRCEIHADRIEYSLSHHDAPMGSKTTLTAVSEEQREELGLY